MTRRQFLALLVALPAARFLPDALAFAADPKADPIVTVSKKDGTILRGHIVSADRTKVVLGVVKKPADKPESTEIAWEEIKTVSNGLTREKATENWKRDNGEKLCDTCHGDGVVYCPTCHGTGKDPAGGKECPACKGAEQVTCTTAHCEKGTIPCPRTCLKTSDPGWVKHPDGLKWKTFKIPHGEMEWSEHHIGDLIVKQPDGTYANQGKCPTCVGKSTIADPACHGTGMRPCSKCAARKETAACPNHCKDGFVECETCKGTGAKS